MMFLHKKTKKEFLLVEPVAKTPYPPLGLMKISSMLKAQYPESVVVSQVGESTPAVVSNPDKIYITTLFTWDLKKVVAVTNQLKSRYPDSEIVIGGIAASLMPDYINEKTGITAHHGLLNEAELYSPDYSVDFGRKLQTSITFTTRGCIRKCNFCTVKTLEPLFVPKNNWERDINESLPVITFWDNNWLASPNMATDVDKLLRFKKRLDFNQGLDARLYDENVGELLASLNIDPIRFAFDDIEQEADILRAINIAKQHSKKEICVYVLYNFKDSPEEFFYKINLLNQNKVLAFPMGYRPPVNDIKTVPNKHWNTFLLRGLKLSLLFYYRRGTITKSRESFVKIYGSTEKEFVENLYRIYEYDKSIKRPSKG
ncbi:MAG TPA: hypothetical protein DDX01_03635 [Holosporales bacterium]|nr:hypothetical protein [Holosporales bacterium]